MVFLIDNCKKIVFLPEAFYLIWGKYSFSCHQSLSFPSDAEMLSKPLFTNVASTRFLHPKDPAGSLPSMFLMSSNAILVSNDDFHTCDIVGMFTLKQNKYLHDGSNARSCECLWRSDILPSWCLSSLSQINIHLYSSRRAINCSCISHVLPRDEKNIL